MRKFVIIVGMKRIFLLSAIILAFCAQGAFAEQLQLRSLEDMEDVQIDMRGYNAIEVPAGTFIPVMNTQEISTQYCSDGYKVKFIVTDDMYMHDTNIIPKETQIYGYVEELHDPVVGTNASFKVRVSKLVYTDGVEVPIKGYLYSANGNMFGGELSEPVKYRKLAHRQTKMGLYPTLQMRPSYERKMGVHVRIPSGYNGVVVLTAPAEITHTLTN